MISRRRETTRPRRTYVAQNRVLNIRKYNFVAIQQGSNKTESRRNVVSRRFGVNKGNPDQRRTVLVQTRDTLSAHRQTIDRTRAADLESQRFGGLEIHV